MSFPPSQLAEKHHFDKKSDFASKFMKSRDYGVAPISGKSSCGMFLSAVRSTYSGCAQTSKYQALGLDEFQSVISVKPIKEQRRSSFKDVFHGSSIFSGIACTFLPTMRKGYRICHNDFDLNECLINECLVNVV